MSHTAPQVNNKSVSEVRNVAVSFANTLDSGESLTGTPTVVEETTSDLTISSKVVNTAILTINDVSVAVGAAVTFSVSGGVADKEYNINISCATDATPAQTLTAKIKLRVDAD